MDTPRTLWTAGHSTLQLEDFLAMLSGAGLQAVADVRRFPASRRHPHFAGLALAASLREAGIDYVHLPDLGGRRTARKDSPNTLWRTAGFRGYADYMATPAYVAAEAELAEVAARARTTLLCAEALWWQCHRGLIADSLKAQGWEVLHLRMPGMVEPHPYTRAARIED